MPAKLSNISQLLNKVGLESVLEQLIADIKKAEIEKSDIIPSDRYLTKARLDLEITLFNYQQRYEMDKIADYTMDKIDHYTKIDGH